MAPLEELTRSERGWKHALNGRMFLSDLSGLLKQTRVHGRFYCNQPDAKKKTRHDTKDRPMVSNWNNANKIKRVGDEVAAPSKNAGSFSSLTACWSKFGM